MRAHFASDVPMSPDDSIKSPPPTPSSTYQQNWSNAGKVDANVWQSRIVAFKMDSGQMADICEFIDDILQKAETEALKQKQERQLQQQQQMAHNNNEKERKSQKPNLADINGKVGNMARVFVVRVFDTICNCANNAATAPMSRFKFRGFKRTSTADSSGSGTVTGTRTENGVGATSDTDPGTQNSIVGADETTEMPNSGKSDFSFTNKLRKSLSGIKEKKGDKQKSNLNTKSNANVKEDGKQVETAEKLA